MSATARAVGILAALIGLVCWLNDWLLAASVAAVLMGVCVVAIAWYAIRPGR